jgi:hypothetical protein
VLKRERWSRRGIGVLLAIVVAGPVALRTPAADAAATTGSDPVAVIVTVDPDATHLMSVLDGHLVHDVASLGAPTAYAATVDRAQLRALADQPGVVDVAPNRRLHPLLTQSTAEIGAPAAWANGLDGTGRVVAIVDTGVDANHPMLAGKVAAEACFTPAKADGVSGYCKNGQTTQLGAGAAAPCTGTVECGHGTHVASVAVGDGDGRRGVAPGARLVAAQVFTSSANPSEGVGTDEATVIRALEWVYSLRTSEPIAAVNLSLDGEPLPTPCGASAALLSVIDRLTAAGIAVVMAAGNDGATTRLSFPACLPNVISVGSVGDSGRVSSFSNSAPSLSLVAPGEDIIAAWAGPCCYREASGTSFASPHVAGVFAVLRQQLPTWSVASLLAQLDRTGAPAFVPATNSYLQAGKIRLDRATRPEFQAETPAALAQASPAFGFVDAVDVVPGGVRVRGWSLDADSIEPVTVHVYVDGVFARSASADNARTDIAAAYAGYGAGHGFDATVPAPAGAHSVCVYALDVGPGPGNSLISCVRATTGAVTGALDLVAPLGGGGRVAGWALDTETAAPIPVHVYVDGHFVTSLTASTDRSDIAAAYPGFGSAHGFDALIATGGGNHQICAYAIDVGVSAGDNLLLGCRTLALPSGAPFGALDGVAADRTGVRVNGWAVDPDTAAPIPVHVYVDGAGVPLVADRDRPDVASVYPSFGPAHGYDTRIGAAAGRHRVCAYAINVGSGGNALLACTDVVVPSSSPFGAVDVAARAAGTVRVDGWVIDPDSTAPTAVHVYVDNVFVASASTGVDRLDVASAFPGAGPQRGSSATVAVGAGGHDVCAYGINAGAGGNALLGCRRV